MYSILSNISFVLKSHTIGSLYIDMSDSIFTRGSDPGVFFGSGVFGVVGSGDFGLSGHFGVVGFSGSSHHLFFPVSWFVCFTFFFGSNIAMVKFSSLNMIESYHNF